MKKSTYSKNLVILFLLALPIAGFFLGYLCRGVLLPKTRMVRTDNYSAIHDVSDDTKRALISKCGDIPSAKLAYIDGQYKQVGNALWSPSCSYIAYNVAYGPRPYDCNGPDCKVMVITPEPSGLNIYVYTKETSTIKKITNLPRGYNSPSFVKWASDDEMVLQYDGTALQYVNYHVKLDRTVSDENRF